MVPSSALCIIILYVHGLMSCACVSGVLTPLGSWPSTILYNVIFRTTEIHDEIKTESYNRILPFKGTIQIVYVFRVFKTQYMQVYLIYLCIMYVYNTRVHFNNILIFLWNGRKQLSNQKPPSVSVFYVIYNIIVFYYIS